MSSVFGSAFPLCRIACAKARFPIASRMSLVRLEGTARFRYRSGIGRAKIFEEASKPVEWNLIRVADAGMGQGKAWRNRIGTRGNCHRALGCRSSRAPVSPPRPGLAHPASRSGRRREAANSLAAQGHFSVLDTDRRFRIRRALGGAGR